MGTVNIRGHLARTQPASVGARLRARLVDLALAWSAFCAFFAASGIAPALRWWWVPLFAAVTALYGAFFTLLPKLTPGEAAWGLRPQSWTGTTGPDPSLAVTGRGPLFQFQSPGWARRALAIFLTLLSVALAGAATEKTLLEHPYWRAAPEWSMTPFLPPLEGQDRESWTVLPFFYTLGAWPTRYAGQPVFHSLPYEKGPPDRFVGRIMARWNPPHVQLTFEGPKTPPRMELLAYERIRECLAQPIQRKCLRLREVALSRHVSEMTRAVGRQAWRSLEWDLRTFIVENSAIPDPERARGIFLSARGPERGQDRFILITAKGTHQTFILEYSLASEAQPEKARELFARSIRSLRSSEELNPGRAWTDRRLQDTRLAALQETRDPDLLMQKLAEIQALLLAKVSVDPKTFDTYYHLGGISLTLFRRALTHPDKLRGSEWAAIAKPMIQSAHFFAQDVNSSDPRTLELQNFAIEAEKR